MQRIIHSGNEDFGKAVMIGHDWATNRLNMLCLVIEAPEIHPAQVGQDWRKSVNVLHGFNIEDNSPSLQQKRKQSKFTTEKEAIQPIRAA